MKIIIAGMSPYLLTSRGKIHSWISQYLSLSGHSIISVVWGHDTDYFVPEDGKYYFNFNYNSTQCRIPIIPISHKQEPSVAIYDIIKETSPDVIITIGNLEEVYYMQSVKQFHNSIKWLSILTQYAFPISDYYKELINDMDAILCTSEFCYVEIQKIYNDSNIKNCYVGCNTSIFKCKDMTSPDIFKIMSCIKSSPLDNTEMLMRVISDLKSDIPEIKLYLHTNINDNNGYDLAKIRNKYDPDGNFILFPDKYVSASDGISNEALCRLMQSSDIYVDISVVSATSMSAFHAISCGCFPLLSACGSNNSLAILLEHHLNGKISKKDILIEGIDFMTKGETYLNICDPSDLKKKIDLNHKNHKNHKGIRKYLAEAIQKNTHEVFMKEVSDMLNIVQQSDPTYVSRIRLETIGDRNGSY